MNIGVIPLGSCIISLLFALTVIDQFFARRKPYQLIWSIGLLMYSISTFTEYWTEFYGLNEVVYRLWYLFGAIFVAAYLGMGTLYLLLRRRNAHIIMAILGIASLYAVFLMTTTEVNLSAISSLSGRACPAVFA